MLTTRHSKRAGFTLLEMLVVVAVIGVLAASIFAVFARVREKGRSATCQSNLKQVGLAILQYTQDNDSHYPRGGYLVNANGSTSGKMVWPELVMPYLMDNKLLRCPSQSPSKHGLDYAYNAGRLSQRLGSKPLSGRKGRHENLLVSPSQIWVNRDSKGGMGLIDTTACAWCGFWETLHSGGANYSFVDGHIKWLAPAAMTKLERSNGPPAR